MDRNQAATQAKKTLEILTSGRYHDPSGGWVSIRESLRRAIEGTVCLEPTAPVSWTPVPGRTTRVQVENQTTLAAARTLVEEGFRPVALNFASARRPGGGFLSGSQAQEESLARATGLFTCIEGQPMYDFHRQQNDPMYSDTAIYSPGVPVFRDDSGSLLAEPYELAIISCAAPNASRIPQDRRAAIIDAMRNRISRVLEIGLAHGHDAIVLGAWGCGVFGNDKETVAGLFRDALREQFKNAYGRVLFAVFDTSRGLGTLRTFQRALGGATGR